MPATRKGRNGQSHQIAGIPPDVPLHKVLDGNLIEPARSDSSKYWNQGTFHAFGNYPQPGLQMKSSRTVQYRAPQPDWNLIVTAGLALSRTRISRQCQTLTEFSQEGKGPSPKRHKAYPSCDTKNSLISTMKVFCLGSENMQRAWFPMGD